MKTTYNNIQDKKHETVLITGGTGIIGRSLCKKLKYKGYNVAILSRTNKPNIEVQTYIWNIDKSEIEKEAFEKVDHIIHLAGTNIGDKYWTNKRKQLIIESRVKSSELIFDVLKEKKICQKVLYRHLQQGIMGQLVLTKYLLKLTCQGKTF